MAQFTSTPRFFAVSLSVLMLLGCDSDLDREDLKLTKGAVTTTTTSLVSAKDSKLLRKLQPYIRCINSGSKRVLAARQRYRGWIKNLDKGPTCKERHIRAPNRLTVINSCTTRLESANGLKPRLSTLEKSAATFARAVRALKPLLDQAYQYYSQRRYKGDKCAAGKALHPKLMAAFELASGSDLTMRRQVEYHNGLLQQRRLAGVAAVYGKNHPRYHRRFVMAESKYVLNFLRAQVSQKTPDLPGIEAAIKRFSKALDAMNSAPPSTAGGVGYSLYKSRAKGFLEGATQFLERKRSGKKWTRSEARWLRSGSSGWLVKGSYARVLKRYNKLVDQFNAVRFRR